MPGNSGFPRQWIEQRDAAGLRDALLKLSIPQIMGVPIGAPPQEVLNAYNGRLAQLNAHREINTPTGRAAVTDMINIVAAAREITSDPGRAKEYIDRTAEAGRDLPFDKFVRNFKLTPVDASAFASPKPTPQVGPQPTPRPQPRPPQRAPSSPGSAGRAPTPRPSGASPKRGVNPLLSGVRLKSVPSESHLDAVPDLLGEPPTPSARPSEPEAKKEPPKLTREQEEKRRRKAQFGHQKPTEDGDPLSGPLAFGVGEIGRGFKHVAIAFGMSFSVINMLVSALELGQRELEFGLDENMHFIRAGILLVFCIVGLIVLRRESPVRLGFKPHGNLLFALAAIPVALVAGAIYVALFRFSIAPDAALGGVIAITGLRAVTEGLFFHGFITRTLLIELRTPAVAIGAGALLYGFYGVTFSRLLYGEQSAALGILACILGSGLPLALLYWKTRSVLVVIVAQFIILTLAAVVSMQLSV